MGLWPGTIGVLIAMLSLCLVDRDKDVQIRGCHKEGGGSIQERGEASLGFLVEN